MNYTNFNTCWEQRANRMEQRLGALDGRRFNFPAAPAPEVEADGPATALRPDEVRSLVAAGVIRFPVAVPAVPVVPPAKAAYVPRSPIRVRILKLARSGRVFSVKDLKGVPRLNAFASLSKAAALGLIEVVRAGRKGQQGAVALYRGVKGGRS